MLFGFPNDSLSHLFGSNTLLLPNKERKQNKSELAVLMPAALISNALALLATQVFISLVSGVYFKALKHYFLLSRSRNSGSTATTFGPLKQCRFPPRR